MFHHLENEPSWCKIKPELRVESNHPHTTKPRRIMFWHEYFDDEKISYLWDDICRYDWYIDSDKVFDIMRGWFAETVEESVGVPSSEGDIRDYTFIIEGESRRVSFARYEGEGAIASSETCEDTWQYAFRVDGAMCLITLMLHRTPL